MTASQEERGRILLDGQAASPSMEQGQQGEARTSLGRVQSHSLMVGEERT